MEAVKKFSDLTVGNTYTVIGYDDPHTSKYGISYILKITEPNSDNMIQIWSKNLLAEYISTQCPDKKFRFTVSEMDNKKYPVIDGYQKARKFRLLN